MKPDYHLIGCPYCELVQLASRQHCACCGHRLHVEKSRSLQACWSYLLTAMLLYIPANTLPMMRTTNVGTDTYSTIASGVVLLWEEGSPLIAVIIFIASLLVPFAKFIAILLLCLGQSGYVRLGAVRRTQIYRLAELVGRWSMVDVFVVGFLAALIQMGNLMSVYPGPAALAFAGTVIFTMLAANSIDPRIFWEEERENHV
jgi:paraquat-inducible protein A